MIETNDNTINTGNIQEKTVNSETHAAQTESAKLFTQEQLNNIISERLKKYTDYDALVDYKKKSEEMNMSEIEKLNKKIDELKGYEKSSKDNLVILEKILEQQMSNISEDKQKLIPANFDITSKLNYITDNSEFLLNKTVNIKTPDNKHGSSETINNNLLYGKYTSIEDFASKDKSGFLKAITTQGYQDELRRVGLLA